MRFLPARSVTALGISAALLLAACGQHGDAGEPSTTPSAPVISSPATTPSPSAAPTPTPTPKPIKASDNLDAVTVTGEYGKAPKVDVKVPWAIDETRTEVLVPSDGPKVGEGQPVTFNYAGVNGRTGKVFDESFSKSPITLSLDRLVPGFSKGVTGQKQGSRVLVAMPGKDGYDASGGRPDANIEIGDTLVFVVDLVSVQLSGPQGDPVTPEAGLPTVVDKNGAPEITIPKTDPPKTLRVQPLIRGRGRKVAENDQITFNYRWLRWKDGKLLEQSYGGAPAQAELTSLLPGMVKGLTGQTVGSRVLLVIPPAEGYPDGNPTPSLGPNETLVMVVDLLFTQAPRGQ